MVSFLLAGLRNGAMLTSLHVITRALLNIISSIYLLICSIIFLFNTFDSFALTVVIENHDSLSPYIEILSQEELLKFMSLQ